MKKIFALFCTILFIFTLVACSKTDNNNSNPTTDNSTNETQPSGEEKPFDNLTNPDLEYIKNNSSKTEKYQTIINEEGKEETVEIVTNYDYILNGNYDGFNGEYRYTVTDDKVTDSKFIANTELKMEETPEGIIMSDKEREENNVFIENVIKSLEKFKKEHTVDNETYIISDLDGFTTTQYPTYDQIRSDYNKLLTLENGLTDFEIMYSTSEYIISYKVVFTEVGLASLYVTTISYK